MIIGGWRGPGWKVVDADPGRERRRRSGDSGRERRRFDAGSGRERRADARARRRAELDADGADRRRGRQRAAD